ncbi:hypothetical protein [Arthrobacter sp. SLBN-122]|uniref:hypothetical protein n=1 Tax=Arthrobacter sp. SLBN-122 TaxID=2768455 RepID=UPI0011539049|nr:hypothetical protein [Arthrobacter sp. SLBN-122]TQJ36711.1 hypothetical protein FBY36_4016 [Arthrobacter sp. SLBN-122]
MTTDDGPTGVHPTDGSHSLLSKEPAATGPQQPNPGNSSKRERPKTILALMEYAYSEAGRKLNLSRKDIFELSVRPEDEQAETDTVRQLAGRDLLFAVPPALLSSLAELGSETLVRRRVLDLVVVAFASHKLFEGRIEHLTEQQPLKRLTAEEVNRAAKQVRFSDLGLKDESEFTDAGRERLRTNAVTALELFRVLRDRWTSRQFIEDMSATVWDAPALPSAYKTAAVLATARNTEALSQVSRHFESVLRDSKRETEKAISQAREQELRAIRAEGLGNRLATDLEKVRADAAELAARANELELRLSVEQSNRVVDKSHHVDDYEALRTQVIRRLATQAELLGDGLHALRHGSTGVAEEFVDRALTAIGGEVTRLKELDGGVQ